MSLELAVWCFFITLVAVLSVMVYVALSTPDNGSHDDRSDER